jgi:hypothetical protein
MIACIELLFDYCLRHSLAITPPCHSFCSVEVAKDIEAAFPEDRFIYNRELLMDSLSEANVNAHGCEQV